MIETGWTCTTDASMKSVCTPICGDSVVRGTEECDPPSGTIFFAMPELTKNQCIVGCSVTCRLSEGYYAQTIATFPDNSKTVQIHSMHFLIYGGHNRKQLVIHRVKSAQGQLPLIVSTVTQVILCRLQEPVWIKQ